MRNKKNLIVTILAALCIGFFFCGTVSAEEDTISEFRFESTGKVTGDKLEEYGDKDGYLATYGKGSLVCYMDNINARALEWSDPEYNGGGIVPIVRASDKNRWGYVPSFVISFSTKDYIDINLSAEMGASSNGPSQWKLQYSTDGANYIDIDESYINIEYDGRKTLQNYYNLTSLTADVNDRNLVYVRIIASSTFTVVGGDYTANAMGGEVAINNIVIRGTLKENGQQEEPSSSSSVIVSSSENKTENGEDETTSDNTTGNSRNNDAEHKEQTVKQTTTSSIEGKTVSETDNAGVITNSSSEGSDSVRETYTVIVVETKENGETVTSVVVEEDETTTSKDKKKKKNKNKETDAEEETNVADLKEKKVNDKFSFSSIVLIAVAVALVAGIGTALVIEKNKNKG